MNFADYSVVVALILASVSLTVHAAMVGNPDYGWQPRSWVVRTLMIVTAILLTARAYMIHKLEISFDLTAVGSAWILALMFFAAWLDMMVASWRRTSEEATEGGRIDGATVVADGVLAVAAHSAEVSEQNAERLDRIEKTVSILDPAPYAFRNSVRKAAGLP